MADLFDNPMGLMGFEFVEFASPAPGVLEPVFEKMGFSLVARHRIQGRAAVPPGRHQLHRQPRAAQPGRVLRRRARPQRLRPGLSGARLAQGLRAALELGAQPWKSRPGRWSCACRRSRASAARRCT
jgi:4-hydroxyphenylpyruvate dioxygenase